MSTHSQAVIAMAAYVAMLAVILFSVWGPFKRRKVNRKKNTNKRPKGIKRQ